MLTARLSVYKMFVFLEEVAHRQLRNVVGEYLAPPVEQVDILVRVSILLIYAMAVCIDSIDHENSLGSIAGDDTILIITQSNETATILAEELKTLFGKK